MDPTNTRQATLEGASYGAGAATVVAQLIAYFMGHDVRTVALIMVGGGLLVTLIGAVMALTSGASKHPYQGHSLGLGRIEARTPQEVWDKAVAMGREWFGSDAEIRVSYDNPQRCHDGDSGTYRADNVKVTVIGRSKR